MFKIYKKSCKLPPLWDELAGDNLFIKRDILSRLEELNPCNQTYHFNKEKKIALVCYRLKLDIFTFSKQLSLKVPVNIIGIPMSVSKCGYSMMDQSKLKDLKDYIKSLKGFYIVLNSNELSKGNTLPTYRLPIRWNTLDEYILSMRSHYRYRLKKAIKRSESIKMEELKDNALFDEEMYRFYCNVYDNSREKLEKLSISFFREFPSKIIKFIVDNETIAFIQLVENDKELIFLFGGFKYSLNKKYDLYINMLLKIIEKGIDNGFQYIDLGQTAEETKSKLGAVQQKKYMYVHHSNPLINIIINKLIKRFSYNPYNIAHDVFKEGKNEGSTG